ncbi:MAG: hypothetical protein MI924_24920, partial [Chloroflexales bacterium]|nr:hypothetical protein [Chloroflexales bacterium]
MSTNDITDGRAIVLEHLAAFERMVARAEAFARSGQYQAAAVFAQIAAKYAVSQHTGLFASPQLERLLVAIGRRLPELHGTIQPRRAKEPRRILHVLTQVARVGGHTRMLWRWIEQDGARQHSVVLTRQGAVKMPDMLRKAVEASGGALYALDNQPGNILSWAATLRAIASRADIVVLHVNPDDVIPVLAFADKARRPPTIYINHADHIFWIGVAVADILANLRFSGQDLAIARRGVAA